MPALPHSAVTPLAQCLAQEWGQLALPLLYRFIRRDDAPLEKHFRQVLQAQLEAEAPEDDQPVAIRWILQTVKRRPRTLIELSRAHTTVEATVPQLRARGAFGDRGSLTVGASHTASPFGEVSLHAASPKTKMGWDLRYPFKASATHQPATFFPEHRVPQLQDPSVQACPS
jgi:hypothetical protein